jgi:hypothetical protein
MADRLARQASAMPLLGPEPALGIPKCQATRGLSGYRARRRVTDSRGPVFVAGLSLNK